MKNGINTNRSCCLAALSIIFCFAIWLLGNINSPSVAAGRITGADAVASMQEVLGSPEQFIADMKESTQDFVKDHFGSLAIATAFGIALRKFS